MTKFVQIKWLVIALILFAVTGSSAAQDQEKFFTRNPLDEIRDELVKVLEDAGLPFTEEQEESIIFVLEESRRASEQLFGDVMDFSGGPPQGEQLDRALAGIAWMNEDFSKRIRVYLTQEQLAVWDEHVKSRNAASEKPEGTAGTSRQVQQIRVNRNPFTAENQYTGGPYSGGSYGYASGSGIQAEIIRRGGTGAWHGNVQFQLKDEALDARNPFASNKPSYQQRNINLTMSGPLLQNRLTILGHFTQSIQDNAATVNAVTLEGPVQIGFTRPQVVRYGNAGGDHQITAKQTANYNYNRQRIHYEKQGMGGFTLPERAYDYIGGMDRFRVRHVWFASDRLVQDISFLINSSFEAAEPATVGGAIDVLGAFNGGGGQTRGRVDGLNFSMNSLWIYTGNRWIIRTGGSFQRLSINRWVESNFLGTFTFPDLDSYRQGLPILYKETRGDPGLEYSQIGWSAFFQNEFEATDRITLFFGLRYEKQTNLADNNNFDPRVAVAFAVDNSTVARTGFGIFRENIAPYIELTLLSMDGKRQYEIIVDNPSYPDPFQTGRGEIVPPSSRRVRSEALSAPYAINTSFQIERSFPKNLFVTASYDYQKRLHIPCSRNLNAPLPGETERPNPSEGNVWFLESTGIEKFKAFRISMRQRFSIFNVNANYSREVIGGIIAYFGAPTDNFNLRADYAEYVHSQISTAINSRLFWKIYLTTNVSYSNGDPYTVTTGYDDNGDGVTNDRPEGVLRYSMRGPHQGNVRFNLSKAFTLGKPRGGGAAPNVNLFANLNNAFNRTNYGTPVGILSSPFFGKSISAFNPRQITIGLRFQF